MKLISIRLHDDQVVALEKAAEKDVSSAVREAIDFYITAKMSESLTLEEVREARKRLGIK